MDNETPYHIIRKELRSSIKEKLPKLKLLKKKEDEIKFYDVLLDIEPNIKKHIIKIIHTDIQKVHFKKITYNLNNLIDQLFIETYDHIENFSDDDEFYIWLYKKTNEILDDVMIQELEEIAQIRNSSLKKVQQLLNETKKALQISFFNRYPVNS
ncbi:hypothetical protein K8354_15225 [Polaribacter litorisediminis]|uniref:hypothetical protein n=1 Tax=Polaribacter litorisediminis TaxID=1908341 RepID=UPI001CBF172B|nr:hypothetical protein [Polaribacter litorisediminis]UAM97636.1 hypothetical protein K8354_15225 [Polaribacter litorisediminis]